jgi:hypothetical protein
MRKRTRRCITRWLLRTGLLIECHASWPLQRITNRPSKMVLDGRNELGRRIKDLAHAFADQLGGWTALSDTLAANVRKAAELTALAEKIRADALRNGNVDPLGLVRLEGDGRKKPRTSRAR